MYHTYNRKLIRDPWNDKAYFKYLSVGTYQSSSQLNFTNFAIMRVLLALILFIAVASAIPQAKVNWSKIKSFELPYCIWRNLNFWLKISVNYSRVWNRRRAGNNRKTKKNKRRALNKHRAWTKCANLCNKKAIKLENFCRPW